MRLGVRVLSPRKLSPATINTRESLFLADMHLAPRPVIIWSPEFVEALIKNGRGKVAQRAVKFDAKRQGNK